MNRKKPNNSYNKTQFQTALELAFSKALGKKSLCIHTAEFVITHTEGKTRKCMKCGEWYT